MSTKTIPPIEGMHPEVFGELLQPEEKFRFIPDETQAPVVQGMQEIDPAALADAIAANEARRVETINRLVDKLAQVQVNADLEKDKLKAQLRGLGWKAPRHKAVKNTQDSPSA